MNNTGRKSWARVGINRDPGAVDESGLSGPVKQYKLTPDEIDKIFKGVKPEPIPEENVKKPRYVMKDGHVENAQNGDDEVNHEEDLDIDEIERIESGATDPAWGFDGCKW